EGIFYTPQHIVADMLRDIKISESTTFLDPCCGCGNFIIEAIRKGVKVENIYGYDTDRKAVEITKQRIFSLTGIHCDNILTRDFLEIAEKSDRQFDLIYTNPPWGKKLPKDRKNRLANTFNAKESSDTCSLFFFASLKMLAKNGKIGFLMPESVLNISTFACLREKMLSKKITEIKDYGKPFLNVYTKAYSIIISNCSPAKNKVSCIDEQGNQRARLQESFCGNPQKILNVWASQDEQNAILQMLKAPHTTLLGNADWALGIITGDNKNKCKKQPAKGLVPIFRGKDISPEGLAKPSLFISKDLKNCQQVAPTHIYMAREKLIYRFISNRLVFFCDSEQRYILNSANCLVPHPNFPLSGKSLCSLLNSNLANWIFSKIFKTHKILRRDLESMPIFTDCYHNGLFDEEKFIKSLNIVRKNGTYLIQK
ncbi:MAG: N-6 DNA methylase, partial [Bacteroidales bacterium]|nr:N-6 DNA methylase [Bacteroidales bacterium]